MWYNSTGHRNGLRAALQNIERYYLDRPTREETMNAGKSIVAGLVLELILLVLVGAALAAVESPPGVVISELA